MRPSSQANLAIKGTLGRAQRYTGLRVIACVFLSNHYHLLVLPDSERQLASFMQFLNTNLSKQLGRLHHWRGPLFHRRYQAIPISDEKEAQVARLRYLLEHGTKEGLVRRPAEWPGVQCVKELTRFPSQLHGIWLERTAMWKAAECGKRLRRDERVARESLKLSPLPAWETMTLKQRFAAARELVADIEARTRKDLEVSGSRPVGVRAICAQRPHDRPRVTKQSPAPVAHAASVASWLVMKREYRAFVVAYQRASSLLREGIDATFPPGCFPPSGAFVPRAGPVA